MAIDQFDRNNYPTTEPETLIAGSFWTWRRDDLATPYPVGSYSLSYNARPEGGATEISFSATESESTYFIEIPSATTAAYVLGTWHWQAYIIRSSDSEKILVSNGYWKISGNFDTSTADPRSTADYMVVYLEATLKELAQKHASQYAIADRNMIFADITKTREELNYWKSRLQKEIKAARRKAGKPTGDVIATRFSGLG